MKKLFTILPLCLMLGAFSTKAQIYSQNFNTGSASDWSLNTSDLGGTTSTSGNQWLINSTYAAGPFGTATADQISGITGFPHSNYMHINCGPGLASLYGSNCNYNASGSGETYFAALNTPIVTTGFTAVNFSFWWICEASPAAAGKVFYLTSASGTWTQITTPMPTYFGNSAWLSQTVHLAAFDNQPFLEFGFQFTDEAGSDPAFGIDEIKVTGTSSASVPVPSFTMNHTAVCQDSCITFTSTSTGTIDSIRWKVVGVPYTSTVNPLVQCFTSPVPPGTYFMRLYAFGGGGVDSVTQPFTVNPSPHPTITKTGHVLSVPAVYTAYQWYNAATAITGATNATYTYTSGGTTYSVVVDSAGCKGTSQIINTVGLQSVTTNNNTYWISAQGNNVPVLYSTEPLEAALTVSLFDATGRKITSDTWAQGANNLPLAVNTLPEGLYIIKLSNYNTSMVIKWIK